MTFEARDLLERATRDLAPDTERLLALGTVRGRRSLRRRRVATTALSGLAVALTGVALQMPGSGSGQVKYADDPPPSDDLARTLARLLPGDDPRTDLTTGTDTEGAAYGQVTWRGAQVYLSVDTSSRTPVPPGPEPSNSPAVAPPATAEDWCRTVSGPGCEPVGNGDWVRTFHAHEPGDPGNWQRAYVLYTADGSQFLAGADPVPPGGGETPAAEPVLTIDQLRRLIDDAFGRHVAID